MCLCEYFKSSTAITTTATIITTTTLAIELTITALSSVLSCCFCEPIALVGGGLDEAVGVAFRLVCGGTVELLGGYGAATCTRNVQSMLVVITVQLYRYTCSITVVCMYTCHLGQMTVPVHGFGGLDNPSYLT